MATKLYDSKLPMLHIDQEKIVLLDRLAKQRGENRSKTIRAAIDIGINKMMEEILKKL